MVESEESMALADRFVPRVRNPDEVQVREAEKQADEDRQQHETRSFICLIPLVNFLAKDCDRVPARIFIQIFVIVEVLRELIAKESRGRQSKEKSEYGE